MTIARTILLGLACGAALAGPALAKRAERVDDSNFFGPLPTADALALAYRYGACLVEKRPKVTRDVLALDFRTEGYDKRVHAIGEGKNGCVRPGRLRVGTILFAAAMAEAAYKTDFGDRDVASVLPADWTANPLKARNESEVAALCLVQRDRTDVRAMLDTQPASADEKVALGKLAAGLPNCLAQGVTFRLNRPALRAILSLALYRSARHFAGQDV